MEHRPGDVHRLVRVVIEFQQVREQSKANVLMGLESTQSHMSSLGRGEVLDEDAIIAARPALWGGRLFCSPPAFPWGKVPRRGR